MSFPRFFEVFAVAIETQFIEWLESQHLDQSKSGAATIQLGIGDDAAVINTGASTSVLTTDTLVDQVHFDSSVHSPQRIGRKALSVCLSDLAAMSAIPTACLLNLSVPARFDLGYCQEIVGGLVERSQSFNCPLVGGDFTASPETLVITTTAFGVPTTLGIWRMDQAIAGDTILVSGSFGGSIRKKHLDFLPRLELAERIRQTGAEIHAVTDVSDGLIIDLHAICVKSQVGADIDTTAIPAADDAQYHDASPTALRAMYDGEDFELIVVCPPSAAIKLQANKEIDLKPIGTVVSRKGIFDTSTCPPSEISIAGYRH